MSKEITREEAIRETVSSYIKNYNWEFKIFLGELKVKRAKMTADGSLMGENGKKDRDMRLGMRLPERLLGAINELLTMHNQGVLFKHGDAKERDEEYRWFKREFPMFLVPETEQRKTLIR